MRIFNQAFSRNVCLETCKTQSSNCAQPFKLLLQLKMDWSNISSKTVVNDKVEKASFYFASLKISYSSPFSLFFVHNNSSLQRKNIGPLLVSVNNNS